MWSIRLRGLAIVLCAAVAWSAAPAAAEPAPGQAGWIYDPGKVVIVDLTLSPSAEAALEAEPDEYVEGGFAISTTDGVPGGEEHLVASRDPVGIRLKGSAKGSFRKLSEKAAFKVKFKQFGGSKFEGLKKMTFNNMVEDFSLIHETLAYTAYRGVGLPASRTGYAFIRVNGHPYGLYLDIEDMDDVALERWFGAFGDPQHLYEGEAGADVVPGADALPPGEGGFEVDEGDEANLDDLKALIAAVNSTAGEGWSAAIAPVANLAELTRIWAVEKYIGHWDGYAGQAGQFQPNNYFLYSDPAGVFQMLPWGADETFERRLAFDGPAGLMFDKCLADPACKSLYRGQVREIREAIAGLGLNALAVSTAAFVKPWWEADPRLERPDLVDGATAETESFLDDRPAEVAEWLNEKEAATVATAPLLSGSKPGDPGPAALLARVGRSGRYVDARLRLSAQGRVALRVSMRTRKGRKRVCASGKAAGAAGELELGCRLSQAAMKRLAHGSLRLRLAIAITLVDGRTETIVHTLRLTQN
jgi:CotH kinase protein